VICPWRRAGFIREIPEEFLDGALGEKEEAERQEYLGTFFQQVQQKFAQMGAALPDPEPPPKPVLKKRLCQATCSAGSECERPIQSVGAARPSGTESDRQARHEHQRAHAEHQA